MICFRYKKWTKLKRKVNMEDNLDRVKGKPRQIIIVTPVTSKNVVHGRVATQTTTFSQTRTILLAIFLPLVLLIAIILCVLCLYNQ